MGDVGHGIATAARRSDCSSRSSMALYSVMSRMTAVKIEVPEDFGHGEGDAQGEFLAGAPPGAEAPLPAQHVGLPGGQVTLQKAGVGFGEGGGMMSCRSWPMASSRE